MNQSMIDNLLKRGVALVSSNGIEITGRDDGLINVIGGNTVYQPKTFWKAMEDFKGLIDITWRVK